MADRDANQAVYVISVAAELTGMHPQTLRIYERKGLLDPSRTSGGSRRFSEHDLERLRHIQELTSTGLNLEGVRRVLQLESELARLREELVQVRAQALEPWPPRTASTGATWCHCASRPCPSGDGPARPTDTHGQQATNGKARETERPKDPLDKTKDTTTNSRNTPHDMRRASRCR